MDFSATCAEQLLQHSPERIVLIGPFQAMLDALKTRVQNQQSAALNESELWLFDSWQTFESSPERQKLPGTKVAACFSLDAHISGKQQDLIIGSACRAFPLHLLVEDTAKPSRDNALFFAHGFRQLVADVPGGANRKMFEFRLHDYKQSPDWLNARFWAHPERFNVVE